MVLGDLVRLSVDVRSEHVLTHGRAHIREALEAVARRCPAVRPCIDEIDLGWAVSWNLRPPQDESGRPGVTAFDRRWAPTTSWDEIWDELRAPRQTRRGNDETTLLQELATSVACEHRHDWRHADAAPVNHDAANEVFDALYQRSAKRVAQDVARRFGERAGHPDDIADEAWSRVFGTYWSATARRRFAGLSRISTLVSQVARFAAIDALRSRAGANDALDGEASGLLLEQLSIDAGQGDRLVASELRRQVLDCSRQLPARRLLIAHLVWLRQLKSVDVARQLSISEPAVARHLKLAREAMQRCLGAAALPFARPAPGRLTSSSVLRLIGKGE